MENSLQKMEELYLQGIQLLEKFKHLHDVID